MNIEGNKVIVEKSAKEMYTFFTDVANFEKIMPENIQKFQVDGDSFLFELKGMPEIRLIIKEKIAFSNITLGSASSKLPFTLIAAIKEISDTKSEVQLTFNGTFNPMMTMMVKKPLTKFIDILTENISKTTIPTPPS